MREHQDLRTFHRLRKVLKRVRSQEKKRGVLVMWLRKHRWLESYLRSAKDPKRQHFISSKQVRRVAPALLAAAPSVLRGPAEILYLIEQRRIKRDVACHMWGGYLRRIRSRSLRRTANCILDKNLRCGLKWSTCRKAFRLSWK